MSVSRQRDEDSWAAHLAQAVGQRVREIRKERGLSAQALANRTAEVGHEVKRSVIADMEVGERIVLHVADWLALARALEVAPLVLLFPPTAAGVEVLPGESVNPWDAHEWVTGATDAPRGGAGEFTYSAEASSERLQIYVLRDEWRELAEQRQNAIGRLLATPLGDALRAEREERFDETERRLASLGAQFDSLGLSRPRETAQLGELAASEIVARKISTTQTEATEL